MKKKTIYLLGLLSLTSIVTSCFGRIPGYEEAKFISKDINVYLMPEVVDNEEVKSLASYKKGSVSLAFKENEELLPFISLESYSNVYSTLLDEGFSSKINYSYSEIKWTVSRNGAYYFICDIDLKNSVISYAGSLISIVETKKDYTKTGLSYESNTDSSVVYHSNNRQNKFSYGNYGYEIYRNDGKYYFPLALLDSALSDVAQLNLFYNYNDLFIVRDGDELGNFKFLNNEKETTITKEMKAATEKKYSYQMPQYLKKYVESALFSTLDNHYGLNEIRNIGKVSTYLKNQNFYSNLFSDDNELRASALLSSLNVLDDDHTGFRFVPDVWEDSKGSSSRGEGSKARRQLRNNLNSKRDEVFEELGKTKEDVIYSNDGKTASFAFDSFKFGQEGEFYEADEVTVKEDAYKYDSYMLFKKQLNEMKNNNVENVIIDLSVNGGGVVGVMLRLLALISKNNSATCTFDNYSIGYTQKMTTTLDTAPFGNDFNFYLLTSNCSFSCGNAFPWLAKRYGLAKVIGQKSGGGECTVGTFLLPNGYYAQYSSKNHIGDINEKGAFIGDESGAVPDILIPYDDFYDIEKLANYIA